MLVSVALVTAGSCLSDSHVKPFKTGLISIVYLLVPERHISGCNRDKDYPCLKRNICELERRVDLPELFLSFFAPVDPRLHRIET